MQFSDIPSNIKQLIKVEYITGFTAKLFLYENIDNNWIAIDSMDAFIGKNGITKQKREGDCKTPLGLYKINRGFGIKDNPGTRLDYFKLTGNEYWVDDILSTDYNKLIIDNIDNVSAEHLINETKAYNYVIVIEYNTENIIKGNGSAIFLHVSKNGGTAGCVAVDEDKMIDILKWIEPNKNPYIYIEEN